MASSAGDITVLLNRWREGEPGALDELAPLVYPHLHRVASSYMRREKDPGLLQATALVNEVYLRLMDQRKVQWADRSHFYAFAAKLMRMILIDQARGVDAQKRGGGAEHVPLDEEIPWVQPGTETVIDLNRALDELEAIDPRKVRLVELRFFLGCTAEETAELTQLSKATVDRDLTFAKSWLYQRMHPAPAGSPGD